MRVLKGVILFLLLIALSIGGLLVAAPWLDGPILHMAGGPFKQASVNFSELDTAALEDTSFIEIEVRDLPRPSVTVGVLVLRGEMFVPATLRPAEKRWPAAIEKNARVRIRHGDKVVDAVAHRVLDRDLHQALSELGARKYRASYFVPEQTWYFRVTAQPLPERDAFLTRQRSRG